MLHFQLKHQNHGENKHEGVLVSDTPPVPFWTNTLRTSLAQLEFQFHLNYIHSHASFNHSHIKKFSYQKNWYGVPQQLSTFVENMFTFTLLTADANLAVSVIYWMPFSEFFVPINGGYLSSLNFLKFQL